MELATYLSFLSDLRQTLDSLSALEQKKIQAIKAGDLAALDECMKQEQAATMDLRGREQRRAAMLKELGLEKFSLRDLPSHCPPAYKGQATEISQQVLRSYEVFSSAQEASRTLMESNLRRIQNELEHREAERRKAPSASPKAQSDFRA